MVIYMKQIIQNGYIKGKFEKNLPLFALAQKTDERYWHFTKGKLPQEGTFNISVRIHRKSSIYLRGRIFPIHLTENKKIRDVFLELQRVVKKHKNKRNFYEAIQTFINKNGFDFLELDYRCLRNGYLKFKSNINTFKFLQNFSYIAKIADEEAKPLDIVESKKFKFTKYSDFLDDIYGDKLIETEEHSIFEFYYIFENIINGYNAKEYSFCGYDVNEVRDNRFFDNTIYEKYENFIPFRYPNENLQKFFTLRDDVEIEKLDKVVFDQYSRNTFLRVHIYTSAGNAKIFYVDWLMQFYNLYHWLWRIKNDDRNHTVELDEEGQDKTFRAFPFGDNFYLLIRDTYSDLVYIEGIFNRNNFADLFMNSLRDFFKKDFKGYFWENKNSLNELMDLLDKVKP